MQPMFKEECNIFSDTEPSLVRCPMCSKGREADSSIHVVFYELYRFFISKYTIYLEGSFWTFPKHT